MSACRPHPRADGQPSPVTKRSAASRSRPRSRSGANGSTVAATSWGLPPDSSDDAARPWLTASRPLPPRTGPGAVVEEAKALGIRVVSVQEQFSRRTAEVIAREIGGRVVAVDPLAEDYVENLRSVAAAFAAAMATIP